MMSGNHSDIITLIMPMKTRRRCTKYTNITSYSSANVLDWWSVSRPGTARWQLLQETKSKIPFVNKNINEFLHTPLPLRPPQPREAPLISTTQDKSVMQMVSAQQRS